MYTCYTVPSSYPGLLSCDRGTNKKCKMAELEMALVSAASNVLDSIAHLAPWNFGSHNLTFMSTKTYTLILYTQLDSRNCSVFVG